MIFALFRRPRIPTPRTNQGEAVYTALMDGLTEMEKEGVDRVVISVRETNPNPNAFGRWLGESDYQYHPFDSLGEAEQGMITGGKCYKVFALVRDNVGNAVRYPDKGVEEYHRTHIVPFLSKLEPESNLHYVTKGGVYAGEAVRQFAKWAARSGWTPEAIKMTVKEGIREYNDITMRLMENGGVYKALAGMERRQYTPFEKIMADMREGIESAGRQT